jgi:hypothetical protein
MAVASDTRRNSMGKSKEIEMPRAEVIARLNDQLRKTGTGGSVMITHNLQQVTGFNSDVLTAALVDCNGFDADNDPHGERDFGDMILWGYDLIWKIDYYDKDLKFGSDDPADETVTHRVLTVMLARDW